MSTETVETNLTMDDVLADDPAPETGAATVEQQAAPAPAAEKVAETDTTTQQDQQQAAETPDDDNDEPLTPNERRGLKSALTAERNKTKEWQDRYERDIGAVNTRLETLTRQIQMQQPAAPQPTQQQQPEQSQDFDWSDPNKWGRNLVENAVAPVHQTMRRMVVDFSRREANREFGAEKVAAAEEALKQAVLAGQIDQGTAQSLRTSTHPVADIVQWHQKQETLRRVGNDPDAFITAEFERRMADPAFQAQMLQRIQGTAAANGNGTSTTRTQPSVQLPPTLNRVATGANQATVEDGSPEAIYQYATG